MNWQWYCKGFASVKTLDLQNSKKQNGFRNCSELVILWHLLVVPDIWLCHANQFTNDVACTLYSCTVHHPFFTVWVTISFCAIHIWNPNSKKYDLSFCLVSPPLYSEDVKAQREEGVFWFYLSAVLMLTKLTPLFASSFLANFILVKSFCFPLSLPSFPPNSLPAGERWWVGECT